MQYFQQQQKNGKNKKKKVADHWSKREKFVTTYLSHLKNKEEANEIQCMNFLKQFFLAVVFLISTMVK